MAKPFKFSDAAKLYEANRSIVANMEEIYKQEINKYLDDIKMNIEALVKPSYLNEQKTKDENRYWWISKESEKKLEDQKVVHYYVNPIYQEIITRGRFILEAHLNYENQEALNFLRHSIEKSEYNKLCKTPTGKKMYQITYVEIKHENEVDIEIIAQTVFEILNYLRENHLEFNNKSKK